MELPHCLMCWITYMNDMGSLVQFSASAWNEANRCILSFCFQVLLIEGVEVVKRSELVSTS